MSTVRPKPDSTNQATEGKFKASGRMRPELHSSGRWCPLLSRGIAGVSGSEGGTEEISLVPLGHTGSLRNFVSDQEVHERTFGRRLEIDWLFHVVEWRVIARD